MAVNLFAIHGILQILTFVILFPLGALIALFREQVGKNWFILHISIQILASLTVFIALIIINIAIKNKETLNKEAEDKEAEDKEALNKDSEEKETQISKEKSLRKKPSLHLIIGSLIVCLIVFQLHQPKRKIRQDYLFFIYLKTMF